MIIGARKNPIGTRPVQAQMCPNKPGVRHYIMEAALHPLTDKGMKYAADRVTQRSPFSSCPTQSGGAPWVWGRQHTSPVYHTLCEIPACKSNIIGWAQKSPS